MIDSVNKFAISKTAIITERDLKKEHLFRMLSVVTNLVTSLEFKPIRCATTLYHFGRTRNSFVVIHYILLSSNAESCVTIGYVVFPDCFSNMRNQLAAMRYGLEKKLVLFPAVDLIDAIWKHM